MAINKCYTVGRLKKELENYDDDMKVLLNTRDGSSWDHTGIEELKVKDCEIYDDDAEETTQKSILSIGGNDYDEKQVLDFFWERQKTKREEAEKEHDRLRELTRKFHFLSEDLQVWENHLEKERKELAHEEEYYERRSKEFRELKQEIKDCNETIYYLTR